MIIRTYSDRDKNEVRELVEEILDRIFNKDPRENKLLKEFESNNGYSLFLVVEVENEGTKKIIGTVGLKPNKNGVVRLKRLYLDEEYSGRGIAQRLFDQCIGFSRAKEYNKMIFQSYPIMSKVQSFLRKNGFKELDKGDPEMIYFERDL